ncbi:SctK family type III secretion system sorting platform protein [Sinorhizobium alkalisoli]|uniref:Type III secretion protein n=1 Tax=Sinorhizobium alkalisoli TaxID=1752398 RepID=A0A1E3V790_9HYPH|nr:SctK family type III secretion system sorting platform protein [Sinorhizobium alkalisoli]MCA1489888.1 SctK family type III secretion system sorting platform protein [Ensifer sp. NBAIM29]MCG5477741.1 SctK family type III secretion system sorting platform protein [Sinorhizobium alkalisoli]ODR89335.1 type III secretion protein [Sinorhizobium alkalisoli]QFI65885.1 hypothetical protein EKH55_1011 [Sinorhizobium alkalisoli]
MTERSAANGATGAEAESIWETFRSSPARLIHPRHIVIAYDEAITIEAAVRLQQSDRVQRPLLRLLMEKFELPDVGSCPSPEEDDLKLLALAPSAVVQHSYLAGAVFWGHVLAGEIRSREVAVMKERIGERAFRIAVENRDLAAGHEPPGDLDSLIKAIEDDGRKCWAGWQASLPGALAAWLRLMGEADEAEIRFSVAADIATGVAIVRRLLCDENTELSASRAGRADERTPH